MESIEILAVVESVSNEKGIEEGIIFGALDSWLKLNKDERKTIININFLSIIANLYL